MWFKLLYHSYKKQATKRGYFFDLSLDEFLNIVTEPFCAYCGCVPYQYTYGYLYLGVDRVDNDFGYNVYNCVPCCKECNTRKRNKSLLKFFLHG